MSVQVAFSVFTSVTLVVSANYLPQCTTSEFLNGTCLADWPEYTSINTSSASDCCSACFAAVDRCVGWTFNSNQSPPCHLRPYSTASPNFKRECTSGIFHQRIPPPPPPPKPAPPNAKNVLFIVVDDLRPNLNVAYNHTFMRTPNLDKLAKEGLVFRNAYCQYAYCAPSRNSFMSGRRPIQTRVYSFTDHFREIGPTWTSFPGLFKDNGYFTSGAGKTFHPGLPPNYDGTMSWSNLTTYPYVNQYLNGDNCQPEGDGPGYTSWGRWCMRDGSRFQFGDDLTANNTIIHMAAAVAANTPFFVACGFHRPHLPWSVPKPFFDLYGSPENIAPPLHPNTPIGMPPLAWHAIPGPGFPTQWNVSLPTNSTQANRLAYYAAVSFMDSQVGRVLDALDALGVAENTIVAFTADHGWQLGEHNMYGKMTVFEMAVRVPFIIRDPTHPGTHGLHTAVFAELVDLMPTLAELAGVPLPVNETVPLGGTSLARVFATLTPTSPPLPVDFIKPYTLSQHARCWKDTHGAKCGTTMSVGGQSATSQQDPEPHDLHNMCDCHFVPASDLDFMGLSIRVPQWRYTEWHPWNKTTLAPVWETLTGVELYSHVNDTGTSFDHYENQNAANDPMNKDLMENLAKELRNAFPY